MSNSNHLIFSALRGSADLECPEYGLITPNLDVTFYPERLEFELYLDATDPLVDALANERRPLHLWLRNVNLFYEEGGRTMQAESFCVRRNNALSEWPEAFGGLFAEDGEKRRLLLTPDVRCVELQCDKAFPTPYQIYYADACSGIGVPHPVEHVSLPSPVFFNALHPQKGFFCARSEHDFFSKEDRLSAALEFIHGRDLPLVCEIRAENVRFYGSRLKESVNYMPSSKEHDCRYMEAVIHGFLNLEAKEFASSRAALSFHLAGKQADVFLEGRYILLMTCLEAMDGLRQLRAERTSALLGVSKSAALLINGMRNELVHGKGGYEQAYEAFRSSQTCEPDSLALEDGVADCICSDGSLDFASLWLRLCERLDAFWCAYLKLDASLQERRYAVLSLMPAIAWSEPLPREDLQPEGGESVQLEELRRKIQRLEGELEEKNAQLKKQGDRIRLLQAASKGSLNS